MAVNVPPLRLNYGRGVVHAHSFGITAGRRRPKHPKARADAFLPRLSLFAASTSCGLIRLPAAERKKTKHSLSLQTKLFAGDSPAQATQTARA